MEWNGNPNQPAGQPASHAGSHRKKKVSVLNLRTITLGLLVSIAILILAVACFAAVGGPDKESKYVDGSKMQMVFLSDGQFYFGRIQNLNDDFIRMTNIYYLRTQQQVQPDQGDKAQAAPVIVPLGCEIHRPLNEMIINRDQVVYWENLKEGQPETTVPGRVAKYEKENPEGLKCDTNANGGSGSETATPPAAEEDGEED